MSAAVLVFFREDRERADINVIRRDYDVYCILTANPNRSDGVDFDNLFDEPLLWDQTGDAVEIPEEETSATRALITKNRCAVPVPKNGYLISSNGSLGR